jgi:mycothiol synthase
MNTVEHMSDSVVAKLHLRPFEMRDIPRMVEIGNASFPDDPTTVENREYRERKRDPKLPFTQRVAELDGTVVGFGNCGLGWAGAVKYNLHIVVDPAFTRRGIGSRMADDLEAWARSHGQAVLRSSNREDKIASQHFLEGRGFHEIGRRFEQALNIEHFDEARFANAFDRAAAAGITFNTFEEESDPDAMRRLYDMATPLFRSVPLPGGDVLQEPFEDWKEETFDHPNTSPANTVVAKRNGEFVGYSSIWTPKQGAAFTIMTGTVPDVRGLGVALALKLLTVRIARAKGFRELRTMNDTANPAILGLNEKMGYRRLPAQIIWEKSLDDR